MPTHAHGAAEALLRDAESFARLVEIAARLEERRDAVVKKWGDLYAVTFGADAFFQPDEFRAFFGAELDGLLAALIASDVARLAAEQTRRGAELAAIGAPFSEVVS